jgi:hypothetical protein
MSVAVLLLGCADHPLTELPPSTLQQSNQLFPQSLEKDIDLLFVIDNSFSMRQEQTNLQQNFPRLIEALRTHKLGADGSGKPCAPGNQSGCKIPNVRIGVVSTDLGGGPMMPPDLGCTPNGDGARLQSTPRGSCVGPSGPYIEYRDGAANVQSATKDPIAQVKEAFSCIAQLGTDGCGYEQPLEAARRALDGKVNPTFLRPEALLAVVFITDEDDCSARKAQLFSASIKDNDGFRCFEYGIRCDMNRFDKPGPRKGCKPVDDPDASKHWLHPVSEYVAFFNKLKPGGRVILSAIAGPTDKVEIHGDADGPFLGPSCQGAFGSADPAIRLKHVVDAFKKRGHYSTICAGDFGPALKQLGELIIASLEGQCVDAPPLTENGNVVCNAGVQLGKDRAGRAVTCKDGCLERANCVVELSSPGGNKTLVPRCEPAKFKNPTDRSCDGASCPCWRLVHKPNQCNPATQGSPYALEVLRPNDQEPERGSAALVRCATTPETWGSVPFAEMPQCF